MWRSWLSSMASSVDRAVFGGSLLSLPWGTAGSCRPEVLCLGCGFPYKVASRAGGVPGTREGLSVDMRAGLGFGLGACCALVIFGFSSGCADGADGGSTPLGGSGGSGGQAGTGTAG